MKKSNIIVLFILVISIVSLCMFRIINIYIMPVLLNYAESDTITLSTYIINESIKKNLDENLEINNIIKTVNNSNNEIISIDFDMVLINKSLYNITFDIQKNLRNLEISKLGNIENAEVIKDGDGIIYNIPVGVVFGNSILANLGPKIPVSASMIGDVISNVKTEVLPYGINNSLIKVYINIDLNSMIVLPFSSKKININNEVLIGMKVVQGNIPEFYGSILRESTPLVSSNNSVIE